MAAIGDILYLKSGGRPVTVERVDGATVYVCWMNGNSISRDTLPEAVLVTDNPEPKLDDDRRKLAEALKPEVVVVTP